MTRTPSALDSPTPSRRSRRSSDSSSALALVVGVVLGRALAGAALQPWTPQPPVLACRDPVVIPPASPLKNCTVPPAPAPASGFPAAAGGRAVSVFASRCNASVRAFAASPSIVRLRGGRLLVVLEQEVHPWESRTVPAEVKQVKRVYASDDGGQSWRPHGAIAGIHWPRLIRCASGVYVLGVARAGPSPGNPIVVSKMLDARGAVWSPAAAVTAGRGWGAMSSNTGADVSRGRITVAFEINPSMSHPPVATSTSAPVLLRSGGRARAAAWERPLVADVPVKSVRGFVDSIVVHASLPGLRKPLFFRVAGVDVEARVLRLRLERVTLLWLHKTLRLPAGTVLRAGAGRQQYSALDWVAMAMSADETQDLRRPASWTFVERGVGNPAALHAAAMRALFGLGGDATHAVRRLALGFDPPALHGLDKSGHDSVGAAWEAGFGALYAMEGVVVRLRDRHGGNRRLLSILRVNNDLLCDLAALVEYDDVSVPGQLTGRFLRYAFVPGLSVAHPALLYDATSDLYWLVSNVNRDALRAWNTSSPTIRHNAFSSCETDRSTLALFYSPNAVSWHLASVIDSHPLALDRHFAYPSAIVENNDLLVVSRATLPDAAGRVSWCFNNHNSGNVAFHRVRGFREYANAEWALYQGGFSRHKRRTGLRDEHAPAGARSSPFER